MQLEMNLWREENKITGSVITMGNHDIQRIHVKNFMVIQHVVELEKNLMVHDLKLTCLKLLIPGCQKISILPRIFQWGTANSQRLLMTRLESPSTITTHLLHWVTYTMFIFNTSHPIENMYFRWLVDFRLWSI